MYRLGYGMNALDGKTISSRVIAEIVK